MQAPASLWGGVPTAFCSTAISIVVCAAADHVQILDLDAEALMQQVSVSEIGRARALLLLWRPCSMHVTYLPQPPPAVCSSPACSAPHHSASGCSSRRTRWTSWWWQQTCATRQQWSAQSKSTSAGARLHPLLCCCGRPSAARGGQSPAASPNAAHCSGALLRHYHSSTQPLLPSSALPPVSPPARVQVWRAGCGAAVCRHRGARRLPGCSPHHRAARENLGHRPDRSHSRHPAGGAGHDQRRAGRANRQHRVSSRCVLGAGGYSWLSRAAQAPPLEWCGPHRGGAALQ